MSRGGVQRQILTGGLVEHIVAPVGKIQIDTTAGMAIIGMAFVKCFRVGSYGQHVVPIDLHF